MRNRDLVVIGASAGGVEAISDLVSQLPAAFPATVLVTVHIPPRTSHLAEIISRRTRLNTSFAHGGEPLSKGHIYIAPPDHHMLIHDGQIRLTHGPKENWARPAIDPLFRSAAVAGGPRVIGVILTGLLDDGAAGLLAIKRCGGVAVVQDPVYAAYPEMPHNAIDMVPPDHTLAVPEMGQLLEHVTQEAVEERFVVPTDLAQEHAMDLDTSPDSKRLDSWGNRVLARCPECSGPIWERQDGKLHRYRCLIGHAFTQEALLDEQCKDVEAGLWNAMQTLETYAQTLSEMADTEQQHDSARWMAIMERAAKAREKAEILRSMLAS